MVLIHDPFQVHLTLLSLFCLKWLCTNPPPPKKKSTITFGSTWDLNPSRKHVCEPPNHSVRCQMGASTNGARRVNHTENVQDRWPKCCKCWAWGPTEVSWRLFPGPLWYRSSSSISYLFSFNIVFVFVRAPGSPGGRVRVSVSHWCLQYWAEIGRPTICNYFFFFFITTTYHVHLLTVGFVRLYWHPNTASLVFFWVDEKIFSKIIGFSELMRKWEKTVCLLDEPLPLLCSSVVLAWAVWSF